MLALTAADSGRSIKVRDGDVIVLRLDENPTTGFRWHAARADQIIEGVADSFELNTEPTFGSWGAREFRPRW